MARRPLAYESDEHWLNQLNTHGTYLTSDGIATHHVDIFAKEFWDTQIELLCELGMENTPAFQLVKSKILNRNQMDPRFMHDMEHGGYCAETTNAARRLNDVIRKYEKILQEAEAREPPPLRRQNASRGDEKQ